MAKTRMKTTPTRMQKDALMASTVTITKPCTITTPTTNARHATNADAVPLEEVKKRHRQPTVSGKPIQSGTSPIIVTAPKRTNSISSITSSISHTSDVHSDSESPPPPTPQHHSTLTSTIKTTTTMPNSISHAPNRILSNLLSKTTNPLTALRNRKVFMITEKSDDAGGTESSAGSLATGGAAQAQKRKMYLIMEEENGGDGDGEDVVAGGNSSKDAQKYLKGENGGQSSKKLTLFADKIDCGALTEKFEKILPEILNRIQASKEVKSERSERMATNHVATTKMPATTTATKLLTPKLENTKLGSPALTALTAAAMPPAMSSAKLLNGNANLGVIKTEPMQMPIRQAIKDETNERLPITLPPKKNRTKIITTNAMHNNINNHNNHNYNNHNYNNYNYNNNDNIVTIEALNGHGHGNTNNNNNDKLGAQCQLKQMSAATPVIVSAVSLPQRNNNHNNSGNHGNHSSYNNNSNENKRHNNNKTNNIANGKAPTAASASLAQVEVVPRSINLSTDFHFLMDMLPKLESIPEPHKTNVKSCIERIITQNANIFVKK